MRLACQGSNVGTTSLTIIGRKKRERLTTMVTPTYWRAKTHDEAREAVERFGQPGAGGLTAAELVHVLDVMGVVSSPEHATETMRRALVMQGEDTVVDEDTVYSAQQLDEMAAFLRAPLPAHMLLVHGLCHLLNYDHESDADFEAMVAVEDACLRALKARGFGEDPP